MAEKRNSPVCFDADINLFAPVEEANSSCNGDAHDTFTLPNTKTLLVSPNDEEYDLLLRQLQQRLQEGNGETLYEIGVGDGDSSGLSQEDLVASIATLESLTQTCGVEMLSLREKITTGGGKIVEYLLRRKVEDEDFIEVRVAVVGNVDAGKSTLLGVLTHGELDNGRGFARQKLFRHKHEMESGRTSSVGNDILGFDSHGNVVNKSEVHGNTADWQRICRESSKVVTFIDLAGHEKYLKTTIFGMTGHAPDFAMLMIGANAGIIGMTKGIVHQQHILEHLGLALALNVPVFVVITKIDMCPPNVLQDTLKLLSRVLKSPGCRKIPMMIQNKDDVVVSASNFVSERVCPIFQVSNVSGKNLDLLKMFLNLLSAGAGFSESDPAEFQVDETYSVPGVGTVISGTCLQGIIRLNDALLLGPDSLGHFAPVHIKGIHRKRLPVREVRGGQTCSFALKRIKRNQIRKGMFLVDERLKPTACWEFEGEILVLHHPTTISPKYQAMVHCGSIRQTATILAMNKDHLRTGDKALVHFQFIKQPEFLKPGTRMVFREGRTKAVGTIINVSPNPPPKPAATKLKPRVHHNKHRYSKKKSRTTPTEQKTDS